MDNVKKRQYLQLIANKTAFYHNKDPHEANSTALCFEISMQGLLNTNITAVCVWFMF